jgi:glycosyltransferase involved in cell wall biosynthesis
MVIPAPPVQQPAVAFVTIAPPWPAISGAELRNIQNLTAVAAHAPAGVITLTGEAAPPQLPLAFWTMLGGWLPPGGFWRRFGAVLGQGTVEAVLAALDRHAVGTVILESSHLHGLVAPIRASGRRIVVDFHNVESQLRRDLDTTGLVGRLNVVRYMRRHRRMARSERHAVGMADQVWACSAADGGLLRRWGAAADIRVVPNVRPASVALGAAPRRHPGDERWGAVFIGHLGWSPNVHAVDFIVGRLLPCVRRTGLPVTLQVAGRDPKRRVRHHMQANAAGDMVFIEDPPEVTPLLDAAQVAIVPLFHGGGTRFKVIEAMARGLPVVATRKACEGLDLKAGREVLFAETAEQFEAAIRRLRAEPALYEAISAAGLAAVAQRFGPEQAAKAVGAGLAALAGRSRP